MTTKDADRRVFSTRFIVCGLLLVLAAIGLQPAMASLSRRFVKQTIELTRPLDQLDTTRIRSLAYDPTIRKHETTPEAVGTADWVSRGFRERGAGSNDTVLMLVTYYSSPHDQVPHTPEVCYAQAGGLVTHKEDIEIETPSLGPEHPRIPARVVHVKQAQVDQVILYTFVSNGRFYSDRQRLRFAIAMPGDTHTYFSKVETVATIPMGQTAKQAFERCRTLLVEALPVLLKEHFPVTGASPGA